MVRETGFASARFDVAFREPDDWNDREGGMARAMRDRLYAFFVNDFSGGNLLVGAARNFFIYQSCAGGVDAIPLNFTLEELTSLIITGARGYFSIHFFGEDFQSNIEYVFRSLGRIERPEQVADRVISALSTRPEIWEAVLSGSLRELDPWQDPGRTIDALTLKGGALARSLYDGLDRQTVGALLAGLREQHRGGTFGLDEVVSAGDSLDEQLGGLFTDWLTTTSLPGFVAEKAEMYRVADAEDGTPRYQLLITVRNDEDVPGMFRVYYVLGRGNPRDRAGSDPIRIGGRSTVQYGVVLSEPSYWAWARPYLSLNRDEFVFNLSDLDNNKIVDEQGFNGVRELEWRIPDTRIVTVDDLDDGFELTEDSARNGVRIGGRGSDANLDEGLPRFRWGRPPVRWSRAISGAAWGRYRHTYVLTRAGKGRRAAVFPAMIPDAGDWSLEIHLPHKMSIRRVRKWGTWSLEVEDASGSRVVTFDADSAARGWNTIDTVSLTDGEVVLRLSDRTDGQVVVADAVRWVPEFEIEPNQEE
jgi:hypothetical protein